MVKEYCFLKILPAGSQISGCQPDWHFWLLKNISVKKNVWQNHNKPQRHLQHFCYFKNVQIQEIKKNGYDELKMASFCVCVCVCLGGDASGEPKLTWHLLRMEEVSFTKTMKKNKIYLLTSGACYVGFVRTFNTNECILRMRMDKVFNFHQGCTDIKILACINIW